MPREAIEHQAPCVVSLTPFVREGLAPGRVHASVSAPLAPGGAVTVEYGDPRSTLLEGSS